MVQNIQGAQRDDSFYALLLYVTEYIRYLSSVQCTRDSKRSLLNGIHSLFSCVVYAVGGQLAVAAKIFVTREILCPTYRPQVSPPSSGGIN
jgi:hypothetical protein